jgi:hypothetical protein
MRKSLIAATAAALIALPSFAFAQEYVIAPLNSAVGIATDVIAVPGTLFTGRSAAYGYGNPYGYGYEGYHATKPNSLEMHPSGPDAQDEGF